MKGTHFIALLAVAALGLSNLNAYASSSTLTNQVTRKVAHTTLAKQDSYRQVLLERFLKYTTYDSQSSEKEQITDVQIETAKKLFAEIQSFGLNVTLTPNHYIYVEIPSNVKGNVPTLGFSCHYDVTPDNPATGIKARLIEKYDGQPIVLENGQVIDPAKDNGSYLPTQIGKTIVTSDGTTILSADDKAGVSIIMTMLQTLAQNPNKKHGKIQVVIAPNEDVGRAAEFIEETPYNPDIAFDFDGGVDGEVVVGNFNAEQVLVTVKGHPGHQSHAAENGYLNAWFPACVLGAGLCPVTTDGKPLPLPNKSVGKQGYVELHHIDYPANTPSVAVMDFRLRGFNQAELDQWKEDLQRMIPSVEEAFGVKISTEVRRNYGNVGEAIHPEAMNITRRAFAAAGVTPDFKEERAGTTASMFLIKLGKGAFTIFTGQNNPHAFTEWLSEDDMYKSYRVSLNLIDEVVRMKSAK
ncbi:MAG: tripeptide aminopeptidase PepT [Elusimicrobiaceae bacterium]|nr:tripeptide aminopeptidase PepT [Elusimicrobiaceae bacterium]